MDNAMKSKSVPEMHFPAIWRSKFTDLANSKKTQSLGKNGCRQKCLDKSLILNKKNTFSILTNISVVLHNLLQRIRLCKATEIFVRIENMFSYLIYIYIYTYIHIYNIYIYIYDNQVVGIQHIFFIFKELIKMKKI